MRADHISQIRIGPVINQVIYNLSAIDLTYSTTLDEPLIHNTIGPTIANRKITLATINHNDAYVYKPWPILSICKKLVNPLSATTGLKVTCTLEADPSVPSIPKIKELIKL